MAAKVNVPVDLDRPDVMRQFLAQIDLALPMQVQVGDVVPTLRAAGRVFTVLVVDAALDKAKVDLAARLHVKQALIAHRLLVR